MCVRARAHGLTENFPVAVDRFLRVELICRYLRLSLSDVLVCRLICVFEYPGFVCQVFVRIVALIPHPFLSGCFDCFIFLVYVLCI